MRSGDKIAVKGSPIVSWCTLKKVQVAKMQHKAEVKWQTIRVWGQSQEARQSKLIFR